MTLLHISTKKAPLVVTHVFLYLLRRGRQQSVLPAMELKGGFILAMTRLVELQTLLVTSYLMIYTINRLSKYSTLLVSCLSCNHRLNDVVGLLF